MIAFLAGSARSLLVFGRMFHAVGRALQSAAISLLDLAVDRARQHADRKNEQARIAREAESRDILRRARLTAESLSDGD